MTNISHPIRVTPLAVASLRARLSLQESQDEFARRFRVSPITISNWERGKTLKPQPIHKEIMDHLLSNLRSDNNLIPEEQVMVILRREESRVGNADY